MTNKLLRGKLKSGPKFGHWIWDEAHDPKTYDATVVPDALCFPVNPARQTTRKRHCSLL